MALGGEHGVDGAPYFSRRLECGNLSKDLTGLRSHQIPLELLLLRVPEGSSEVDDLFVFSIFGDGEGGRWFLARPIKVALHLCASDLREHDGLP